MNVFIVWFNHLSESDPTRPAMANIKYESHRDLEGFVDSLIRRGGLYYKDEFIPYHQVVWIKKLEGAK